MQHTACTLSWSPFRVCLVRQAPSLVLVGQYSICTFPGHLLCLRLRRSPLLSCAQSLHERSDNKVKVQGSPTMIHR